MIDRLPSVPVICSDPYLSIWMPADTMTQTDTTHWSGPVKPIRGEMTVDGAAARFMGVGAAPAAELTALEVTPASTRFVSCFGGVELTTVFTAPALPDDLDLMSMPVTLVRFDVRFTDGKSHEVKLELFLSDALCYDGEIRPVMAGDAYVCGGMNLAWRGQKVQKPLSHSGDHITIDWGYLYAASEHAVRADEDGIRVIMEGGEGTYRAVIAYDDIASINYFGDLCKAWYRRDGAQITDAIRTVFEGFEAIEKRCAELDAKLMADAAGEGEAYQKIVAASWRHTICAHKLICTPKGDMAFLSKENDSNGCMATADVSYPSIPLFLKYCPELVNAMCRPILEFASMPVWTDDFAPHDVGRYPMATGQVYASKKRRSHQNGDVHPCYYLYPAGSEVYDLRYQMPVEECGNMLVMLEAAREYGADRQLAENYRGLLDTWVKYLVEYGEDPGEQLCTDDFAGHLAHNVNLAAKAVVGVACYGRLTGDASYEQKAKEMAAALMAKIGRNGDTPLTLDGQGWSMKYNLLWDRVLKLGLFPDEFYAAETASYVKRVNRYGLPLDSRADYTKSDWICWVAAMAEDKAVRAALIEPLAVYLKETTTRVPFSDWYDTKTGRYVHFIARSVQGGLYAPLLNPAK